MVHMASVWVPFTSESKEAIADYDEIRKEMKLALQECGRKLASYIRKRKRQRLEGERRSIFERYIVDVAEALSTITGSAQDRIIKNLQEIARSRTAQADVELDEDGKPTNVAAYPRVGRGSADEDLTGDESTVIVEANATVPPPEALFEEPPVAKRGRKRGGSRAKR
jgi:DNA topoisomerase-6 subunit B